MQSNKTSLLDLLKVVKYMTETDHESAFDQIKASKLFEPMNAKEELNGKCKTCPPLWLPSCGFLRLTNDARKPWHFTHSFSGNIPRNTCHTKTSYSHSGLIENHT